MELLTKVIEVRYLCTLATEKPLPSLCIDNVRSGTAPRAWANALELHENTIGGRMNELHCGNVQGAFATIHEEKALPFSDTAILD